MSLDLRYHKPDKWPSRIDLQPSLMLTSEALLMHHVSTTECLLLHRSFMLRDRERRYLPAARK